MARLKTLQNRVATQKTSLKVINSDSWRATKTTSAERGYGYKWQQARIRHLQQQPLCVYCEANGRITAATVVDHKTPHRGDMNLFWDRANWQSLCSTCHSSVKQREEVQPQ
jgi:5-methylcytosine-specific restriction endonuclease McrA